MITYQTRIKVKLDGKPVGEIRGITTPTSNGVEIGYQYAPKGNKIIGSEIFGSIKELKKSLEKE